MELSYKGVLLLITILLTGLSAGLFYAWQVSVIPGTEKVSTKSYLEVMQAINRAILNPAFFTLFFGSLVLLLLSSYYLYKTEATMAFYLMLFAALTYLTGTFGVTVFGNVPLNEELDLIRISILDITAMEDIRHSYETAWNRWHIIRTIFAVLAFLLSLLSGFISTPL
jgi:uncharacterized membrane protein